MSAPDLPCERWLPVVGYRDLYEVSSMGRIKSLSRLVVRRRGNNYVAKERVMRPGGGKKGRYLSVRLASADGTLKTHYVHAVVLEAFVGPRPLKHDACHADGNRQNNEVGNLRWDTRAANHADKRVHGTANTGERHPMSKLTDEQVLQIRAKRAEGLSISKLAKEFKHFNVSLMTVYRAATGRSWSHL